MDCEAAESHGFISNLYHNSWHTKHQPLKVIPDCVTMSVVLPTAVSALAATTNLRHVVKLKTQKDISQSIMLELSEVCSGRWYKVLRPSLCCMKVIPTHNMATLGLY